MFVNLVQIILVAGMVYPVYAMWNNDQLNNFCVELKSNMTKQHVLDLAYDKNIKLNLANIDDLEWHATASTPARFSDYTCQIKGLADRVAFAKMTPN
jgi:hypothetical protein